MFSPTCTNRDVVHILVDDSRGHCGNHLADRAEFANCVLRQQHTRHRRHFSLPERGVDLGAGEQLGHVTQQAVQRRSRGRNAAERIDRTVADSVMVIRKLTGTAMAPSLLIAMNLLVEVMNRSAVVSG